jgi:chromate reductase, NAD(P)H dehydrogenase (quinone)
MNNIIVFAGSSSRNSINKKLVEYAANILKSTSFELIDLNDYSVPLFSVDVEKEEGFPLNAIKLDQKIENCDGIILSLAEHNGSYAAAFKNIFDWLSRIEPKIWRNKPMLLMSTSTGARGGKGVLAAAMDRFPRHNSNIISTFSLPSFSDHFSENKITNKLLNDELILAVQKFEASL